MHRTASFAGVWPIATTPFAHDGSLDFASLTRVAEHIMAGGAHGLVYPGIASEFQTLTGEERRLAVKHLLAATRRRCPMIVGISTSNASLSPSELARHAEEHGAVAVMLMPPAAMKNDIDALIALFSSVTAACELPIVLQNAPPPLGPALSLETLRQVMEAVPAVRYVKEEVQPCGQRITGLLASLPGLEGVFGGAGGRFVLDELARGALGSMPACEFTDLHVELFRQFRQGNRAEARRLFNRLLPLLNFGSVFRTPATKLILHRMNIIESPLHRDDNPALDPLDREELWSILDDMGVLPAAETSGSGLKHNG